MKAWGLGSFFSSLAIPVGLQKKLLSFLLQRAIGHFLEDDLDLEKLDIELSNGIVHLTDLKLSTRALNGFTAGTPLAVTQGHISSITATIPWRNLWNGQCVLEIDGIDVTLVPVQCDRTTSTDSQDDHILSSSIGLANDFLQAVDKEEVAIQETLLQTFQSHVTQSTHSGMPGDFNSRPTTRPPTSNQEFPSTSTSIPSSALGSEDSVSEGEGIQFVAKLIEKLMARIQIICKRTTIRLRHSSSLPLTKSHARRPHEEKLQYELEIRLPYIGYRDETPGWDQLATSMDASSIRSESVSGSTVLEESVMPSVIWQESPESSIKTIVFKGFSVWIKQKGDSGKPVAQSSLTSASVLDDTICEALGSQDNQSDSDTDIFSDAHENFSQSMVASQIAPRQPIFRSTSSATSNQQTSQECYAAEILSTLQHKNRIKVNIRKNATMTTGSSQAQAQTTTKSLLDIDFHLRTMLIALAPNQIAFILEILTLIDNASGVEAIQCQKKPPNIGRTVDTNINNRSRQDISTHRTNYSGVTAAEGERSLQEPRSDSIAEHSSPIYSHSSLSPNRQHPTDPIRTSQLKTEARHYDFDKSLETMDSKTVTPLSVASLESPRFLSGPSYTDARPTASTSSSAVPSIESSQTIKLKARISILQLFVLYDDPESQHHIPTEMSFYKNPTPEALRADHSKFEVDSMVLRYQQWVSPDACSGQKPTKSTKGQIDFTLNNFTVAEWIQAAPRPYDLSAWSPTSDDYRIPPRRQYIPIIEFDTDQDTLLQASPTSKFPTLHIPDRYLNERTLLLRAKKNKRQPELARSTLIPDVEPNVSEKETSGGTTKEVVRMRVLLNPKKDSSKSSMPSPDAATAMSPGGFTREVTIEVKPVQVHIDLFTLQRLEKCLLAIIGPGQTAQAGLENQVNGSSLKPQRAMEQQIIDDLDANQKNTKTKTRLRLRLNSVQLWVSVPDIGEVLEGKEETGPEYRSHYDMLSINVMKLVLTQASDGTRGSEAIEFGPGSSPESYAPKTKIDFVNSSVFIIPKFQTTSRAVVYIGSLTSHPTSYSGLNNSPLPNIEITTRSPGALPLHYERPILSGYPQNLNLRAFTVLEDEENIHNTTDEEVELLQLKQRTIETSLLVINTQLPLVAVHLHKADLDNLQMRLNDLSTWLTIFSERLVAKMPSLSTPPSRLDQTNAQDGFVRPQHESLDIGNDGHNNFHETYNNDWRSSHEDPFRDDQSEHGTDRSTAYGEELRNQARDNPFTSSTDRNSHYYQYQPSLVKPTMASALIYVQTVEVILDYPTKATIFGDDGIKSYQINIGDTKVFAAAKYQGGNENYLYVDAEELEVYEVTAQKPKVLLLARTIPKNIKLKLPKPMLHLTSILSFDPEIKFKANDINLAFTGISWKFSIEQTAVDDIQDFFAEPENIIYYNPPQQRTRIAVSLSECCMDYKPLHIPSRFVLSFEKMKVFSTLVPESPTLKSKVQIYNMALLLIDHIQSIRTPHFPVIGSSSPGIDSKHYWRLLGFALVGQCPFFELKSIKSKNGQLPLYDLVITNNIFYLETCSDSFDTLMKLAAYMGDNGDMPIEKKKILERLAEAERAANRAKSNVVYQDVLASLDEDAFRKPGTDPEVGNAGTLDFTEGFFSVEQDDSDSDLFKAQMRDTPNVDGFHEVYADLLGDMSIDNGICEEASTRSLGKQAEKGNSSKSKHRSLSSAVHEADLQTGNQTQDFGISTQTNKRISQEKVRRSESTRPSGHMRMESEADGKVIILDSEYELTLVEDHFFIPILTEEEKAREEKSQAKLRLRIRDFNFSWRLYDGLDWEISRLDEAERKKQARQFTNRFYDTNDPAHTAVDTPQSNLDASIFERISGVQASSSDRFGGQYRKEMSQSSSEADSNSDYQNDLMSQVSGMGTRSSSKSSISGNRRSTSQHHHYQHSNGSSTAHHESGKRKKSQQLERSKTAMIEFNADKVRLDFEDYIQGIPTASHLSLRVKQFEIIDNLKTSLWHKFLSLQRPDSHTATPRLTQSSMIRIDLDGVRPVVNASTVEQRLNVRILPLRLYVDQDALIFLIKFFVQSSSFGGNGPIYSNDPSLEGIATTPETLEKKKPNEMYFQSVKVGEISVKVDYKPKHVDYTGLTGGNFVELMNFFHLDAAEMTLQAVRLHGVNGIVKLGQDLIAAWLPHIRSTQVPHMVSGLTPIRSLVNLGSGIADLVLLPIEQYKRDGHIIRGLQRGGQAFTRATTLEALKIGTKLAVGTQVLLEHADEIFGSVNATGPTNSSAMAVAAASSDRDRHYHHQHYSRNENNIDSDIFGGKRVVATMVSDSEAYMEESIDNEDMLLQHLRYQQQQQLLQQQDAGQGTSSSSSSTSTIGAQSKSNKVSKYANQPADINEGMELAYKALSKNIGTAAHTIFAVPMEVYEKTGAQGSVRAVIRAVPVAVLKPMIGATEAFSKVLIGLRNSIDPAQRVQMEDKYKKQ